MYAIIYFNLKIKQSPWREMIMASSLCITRLIPADCIFSLDTIRSLKKAAKVSDNSISKFFLHRCIFPPSTIYEDIFSLEPGHVIFFGDDNSFQKERILKNKSTNPVECFADLTVSMTLSTCR